MIVQGCLVIYIKRLSNDLQVTSAEVQIAMALINSNLAFAAADTFNPLFKSIFLTVKLLKHSLQEKRKLPVLLMVH